MAQALPVAGYVIGSYFGPVGAAVGYLIGSWAMSALAKKKNQIFDPGVQELPRITSALRGATLPVMFGTNRVPANIVLERNFSAIRQETTEGGGGKGGGSGGSKSGGGQTNASYIYKMDLIYHLGMVPQAYQLFRGWIGQTPINPQTIFAITQQEDAPAAQFNNDPSHASLEFEQGVYFPGNHPEDNQWSHLTSLVGAPVRWPSTAWVGFKQLGLGSEPVRPQLSFEIGPGGQLALNSGIIGYDAVNSISDYMTGGAREVSRYNYVVATIGSTTEAISTVTGALVWDRTDAEFAAEINAWMGITGVVAVNFGMLPGGEYLVVASNKTITGTTRDDYYALYQLQAAADPVLVSVIKYENLDYTAESNNDWSDTHYHFDIAGAKTYSDPVIRCGSVGLFEVDWTFFQLPSVNTWLTFDKLTLNIGEVCQQDQVSIFGNNWDSMDGTKQSSWCWLAPVVGANGNVSTRAYYFVTKDIIQKSPTATTQNSYVQNTLVPSYPDGAILYQDFGILVDPSSWSDSSTWVNGTVQGQTPSPVIANADFVTAAGASAFPFTDAYVNRDGSTPQTGINDYDALPSFQKIPGGLAAGAYVVLFCLQYQTETNTSPTGEFVQLRAFIYNPLTAKYVEYADQDGSTFDPVADTAVPSGDRYNEQWFGHWAAVDFDTNKVIRVTYFDGVGAVQDTHVVSTFGDIAITTGDDVTPPYMIRQILVNSLFGVYAGQTSLIDDTSYANAHNYCDDEGIKISAQYRREEDWKEHIELLLATYGGYLVYSGGKFKFGFSSASGVTGAGTSVRTIDNNRLLITDKGKPPVNVEKAARQDAYNRVRVNFFDRSLDYAQNQVEENDEVDQDLSGTIRMREFPPIFVMKETLARKIVLRTLWTNLYIGDTYSFKLGPKDHDLEPGDVVTLVDSHWPELQGGQKVRIVRWKETKRLQFDVTAIQEVDFYLTATTSVQAIPDISSRDYAQPATLPWYSRAYELPQEFQNEPTLYVGWVPSGKNFGARLYVSADGTTYAPALSIEPYPLAGRLLTNLGTDERRVFEENVEIALFPTSLYTVNSPDYAFNETLNEVGIEAMHVGAGLLWVGSEMLAYYGRTLVSQNHYRFSRVYRGWGGTNIQAHNSGDFFWRHGGGIFTQPYNEDKIGTTIYYKVVPYNQSGAEFEVTSIAANSYQIQGRYYRPQVPNGLEFVDSAGVGQRSSYKHAVGSTVDITVQWRDSARMAGYGAQGFGLGAGGFGRFATDTLSHAWRVEVVGSGNAVVRSLVISTPAYTYPQSQNVADNGAYRFNPAFKVTPFGTWGDATRLSVVSLELFQ